MKKFFGEFKKFITRGNVLDMAVGVIVGGAFTAIVNGMSNFILKPVINWVLSVILGKGSLENIVTFLGEPAYKLDTDGVTKVIDLANSFYIDWGAFINAIINFLLIAFVLFSIVKAINSMQEGRTKALKAAQKGKLDKASKKEMKAQGLNPKDKADVQKYKDAKAQAEAAAAAEAEAKAKAEAEANPSTEELLKQIRDLLKNK